MDKELEDYINSCPYKKILNWNYISDNFNLSEEFILKNIEYLDMFRISYRELSEEFMERIVSYLDMSKLIQTREVSEKFLAKYFDIMFEKVDKYNRDLVAAFTITNQKLSPKLISKISDKISFVTQFKSHEIIGEYGNRYCIRCGSSAKVDMALMKTSCDEAIMQKVLK